MACVDNGNYSHPGLQFSILFTYHYLLHPKVREGHRHRFQPSRIPCFYPRMLPRLVWRLHPYNVLP